MLNPVAPRNPAQMIHGDAAKTSPQFQIQEEETKETKYVEGAELIPLPSQGYFYKFQFKNLELLQVRQLDYTDEDILTTRSFYDNGTIFNELLKNVIVDPNGFLAQNLIPVDRETILFWLRSTAFGNDFEITFKCPNKKCGHEYSVKWDLGQLTIPTYPQEYEDQLQKNGEIKIETPLKKVKVLVTVPTIGQSLEAEKMLTQKKIKMKATNDFFGTGSLRLIISGIELENNKVLRKGDEIMNYFSKIKLPLSDSRYIRKKADEINLKYDTKKIIICPNEECKHEEEVELPVLHPEFFWPTTGI